jgi:hypothetical protein
MSTAQHRRMPSTERDDEPAGGASLRHPQPSPARHGNDNLEQAATIDGLAQSKERIWSIFARWLMIGGALGAFALIAVLGFVYSGHPYHG